MTGPGKRMSRWKLGSMFSKWIISPTYKWGSLSRPGPWKKKFERLIFPTKYVIPKSLKFSHWPSKGVYWGYNPLILTIDPFTSWDIQVGTITYPPNQWYVWVDDFGGIWIRSLEGTHQSTFEAVLLRALLEVVDSWKCKRLTNQNQPTKNQKSLEVSMKFWFSSHQPEAKLEPSSNSSLLRSISQNIRKNTGLVL